jgi:hypothetical protein
MSVKAAGAYSYLSALKGYTLRRVYSGHVGPTVNVSGTQSWRRSTALFLKSENVSCQVFRRVISFFLVISL